MLDPKYIGWKWPDITRDIEKGRLRMFAHAIGETDAVYVDEAAAKAAGYASLPMPPTFAFGLEVDRPDPYAVFQEMGVNLALILHGEQSFTYHKPVVAGDSLTFASYIADLQEKKGGALGFITKLTKITNQKGEHVMDLRTVIVARNPGAGK